MNPKQVSATQQVETEISRLITYVNDHVVPEVRRSSSHALRFAAGQLSHLAEHLDLGGRPSAAAPAPGSTPASTADGPH
jgi:hypothetical protein